jgi:hypothetical protein
MDKVQKPSNSEIGLSQKGIIIVMEHRDGIDSPKARS